MKTVLITNLTSPKIVLTERNGRERIFLLHPDKNPVFPANIKKDDVFTVKEGRTNLGVFKATRTVVFLKYYNASAIPAEIA